MDKKLRTIKFRAWHRGKRCWLDTVHVFNDGSWSGSLIEERGEIDGYDERECDLMEGTGITDSNGKEAYEGDIVESLEEVFGKKPYKRHNIVKWEEGFAGFMPFCDYDSDCGEYFPVKFKIIGNIHENGELLKDIRE